ncbi:BCCT family transporter [Congregibacter sp.]|uniref:BCCT family transporter n=1 Tax=Congregibacter sp. TaxID=2744308 RepID=UPI00385F9B70
MEPSLIYKLRLQYESLNLRPLVFWPTFTILMLAVAFSIVDLERFLQITRSMNDTILEQFGWLFSYGSFYLVLLTAAAYLSPLGKVVIGGSESTPLLSKPRWFFITLCTTLAVGILFWTTSEPIYHLNAPPVSKGIVPVTTEAAAFSLSAMFLHWSFTPYAIYTIPSLTFALAFYNRRLPFSISSSLRPVFGHWVKGKTADFIDTLALSALVTGMASSLGTGALSLIGGTSEVMDVSTTPVSLGIAITLVVVTFVWSAASGLHRGIAKLSSINALLLLLLGLFAAFAGPSLYLLSFGAVGIGTYASTFLEMSLFTGSITGDDWPLQWSVFYWAIWFAWAPVSALFLGRLGRGYSVREYIRINFLYPSLFAIVWIVIFSGTAIHMDMSDPGSLNVALQEQGPGKMLYAVFSQFPFSGLTVPLLVFIAFISFVTAADSNTDAIGRLCAKDVTAESEEKTGLGAKILWGAMIGVVSWTMVSFAGVDGIRMLSNLGGIAAVTIVLASSITLLKWLMNPRLLD